MTFTSRDSAAAAFLLLLLTPVAAGAADVSDYVLRGGFSNTAVRWDGVNFGVHAGVSNMDTDFGNSNGQQVAYILRNTIVEAEYAPSGWTTLPGSITNGQSYGAFLGYSSQWEQLVLGVDLAYNRTSGIQSSASDSIARQFATSDGFYNNLTINASSSIKLIDYATFRGRAGYALGQFLPYAIVGVAVGRFNYVTSTNVISSGTDVSGGGGSDYSTNDTLTDAKDNAIVAGFVAGLGLDVAITPNTFVRGEWEFVGFMPVNGIRVNLNTARVGIGVRF